MSKAKIAGPTLRQLDEIYRDEDVVRCQCGSAAFFDWGIQMVHKAHKYPGHRAQEFSATSAVKICVGCEKPIIYWDGDLYDASEFVDKGDIDQLIRWSQEKNAKVPTKVMDP